MTVDIPLSNSRTFGRFLLGFVDIAVCKASDKLLKYLNYKLVSIQFNPVVLEVILQLSVLWYINLFIDY